MKMVIKSQTTLGTMINPKRKHDPKYREYKVN